MRILFAYGSIHRGARGGGIGTYLALMPRALAQRGHEIHLLSYQHPARDGVEDGVIVHYRRPYILRGLARVSRMPHTSARLHAALSARAAVASLGTAFDVIEYPDWLGEGLLIAPVRATVRVAHTHSPLPFIVEHNGMKPTIDLRIACLLERRAVRRADVVTAPTGAFSDRISRDFEFPRDRIMDIPQPIETGLDRCSPAGGAPPTVLFVGRLEPLKNPETVLAAARDVLREVPEARFVFVGGTTERSFHDGMRYDRWLESLAEAWGIRHAMRIEGRRDYQELASYREKARVCVVPSRYESFSYTVVEAMAAARPVVASRVGGIPEIVQDGVTGRLVPPDDVKGWAEAILQYLRDPALATATGACAREEAVRRFAPDQVAKQREAAYVAAMERVPQTSLIGERR